MLTLLRAQGLRCTGCNSHAVLIDGGVAADLTDAVLRANCWNGLRVTDACLAGATAQITLTGAEISGNGVDSDAKVEKDLRSGITLERPEGGASRSAVLRPRGPPWTGVKLSSNRGGDSTLVDV